MQQKAGGVVGAAQRATRGVVGGLLWEEKILWEENIGGILREEKDCGRKIVVGLFWEEKRIVGGKKL